MNRIFSVVAAVLALTTAGRVEASVDITIEQVGSNIVLTGTGSLNISDLTLIASGNTSGTGVGGNTASAFTGPTQVIDLYGGLTGPSSFGSGALTFASSGSGDLFGVQGDAGYLEVPTGYVSGTSLSGSATIASATLAGLGLTNGTYTFNLPNDSLTVQIGPAAVVPEPSTAILAVVGAVAFATYGWSRHRRQQRRQVSA